MLQLTYISSKAPSLMMADLEAILEISRRNNQRDGITGLLVFDGKRFLQALEGEAAVVEHAFQRISEDTRHRAVVELSRRMVSKKQFGPWAMASQVVGPILGDRDIVETVRALTEDVPDPNAVALFRSFAQIRAGS